MATITTTATFIRRRSSAANLSPVTDSRAAFFLPEATATSVAVVEAIGAELTESLLAFDVLNAQFAEEEEYNLPATILPMSPEPSPRNRSASALSTAALESASATISSWFTYEDFESDADALEDEYASEADEDFLMDDYEQAMRQPEPEEPEQEQMPTFAKLSLIAEEEYAQNLATAQSWSVKSMNWAWLRAN